MSNSPNLSPERRSFFQRLSAGAASLAAISIGGAALAQSKAQEKPWQPARHEKDDWLDKLPGKHRLIFDTTAPDGFGDALLFINNYLQANRTDYGLENSDLAVVLVARHRSTPFGYNDAMWVKYGAPLAARAVIEDPKTKEAPKTNIYNTAGYADVLPSRGITLDALFKQGVHLAVCATATRNYSGVVARALGGDANAIFNDLTANLVAGNSRMVPAGIVTINRAQERGYALATV